MGRKEFEALDECELERVLDATDWGVLGLQGKAGRPLLVPLHFVRLGRSLYFHSAPAGEKIDALRRGKAASFVAVRPLARVPSYFFDEARACGATGFFDPRTTYDPINDRWITVMLSDRRAAGSSIEVGLSQTSDPEGAWWTWRLDGDATDVNWVDFPSIGFNKNWVAVNLNLFANSNDAYSSSKVLVIDYPTLRTGSLTSSWFAGTDFATAPSVTLSSTENTLYMPVQWGHFGTGNGAYRVWTVTGTAASPSVS